MYLTIIYNATNGYNEKNYGKKDNDITKIMKKIDKAKEVCKSMIPELKGIEEALRKIEYVKNTIDKCAKKIKIFSLYEKNKKEYIGNDEINNHFKQYKKVDKLFKKHSINENQHVGIKNMIARLYDYHKEIEKIFNSFNKREIDDINYNISIISNINIEDDQNQVYKFLFLIFIIMINNKTLLQLLNKYDNIKKLYENKNLMKYCAFLFSLTEDKETKYQSIDYFKELIVLINHKDDNVKNDTIKIIENTIINTKTEVDKLIQRIKAIYIKKVKKCNTKSDIFFEKHKIQMINKDYTKIKEIIDELCNNNRFMNIIESYDIIAFCDLIKIIDGIQEIAESKKSIYTLLKILILTENKELLKLMSINKCFIAIHNNDNLMVYLKFLYKMFEKNVDIKDNEDEINEIIITIERAMILVTHENSDFKNQTLEIITKFTIDNIEDINDFSDKMHELELLFNKKILDDTLKTFEKSVGNYKDKNNLIQCFSGDLKSLIIHNKQNMNLCMKLYHPNESCYSDFRAIITDPIVFKLFIAIASMKNKQLIEYFTKNPGELLSKLKEYNKTKVLNGHLESLFSIIKNKEQSNYYSYIENNIRISDFIYNIYEKLDNKKMSIYDKILFLTIKSNDESLNQEIIGFIKQFYSYTPKDWNDKIKNFNDFYYEKINSISQNTNTMDNKNNNSTIIMDNKNNNSTIKNHFNKNESQLPNNITSCSTDITNCNNPDTNNIESFSKENNINNKINEIKTNKIRKCKEEKNKYNNDLNIEAFKHFEQVCEKKNKFSILNKKYS